MYRQSLVQAVRPALRSALRSRAAFSTTTRAMAGGDTGAPRSTGQASGWVALTPKLPRGVLIEIRVQRCFHEAGESQRGLCHQTPREGEATGAQEEACRAARTPEEARGTHVSLTPPLVLSTETTIELWLTCTLLQ